MVFLGPPRLTTVKQKTLFYLLYLIDFASPYQNPHICIAMAQCQLETMLHPTGFNGY